MSLYRKFRPQTFDEVLGNEATIESLKKLLEKEDRPHTYLFSGPSGCGKTTLARIMAKEWGAGEFDVREINSSNNRGIDTAREIEDSIQYASIGGRPIVYIIDECHKTTNDWQNAMLKPLEDTPDHIYFILCTTEPKKLIKAIHTRCTPVKVESVPEEKMYRYLRKLGKHNEWEVDKSYLELISQYCDGSPRQALVTLEQIMDMDDPENIRTLIKSGDAEEAEVKELCTALMNRDNWKKVSKILKSLKTTTDPEKVRYAVLGYISAVILNNGKPELSIILSEFSEPFYSSGFPGLVLACYNSLFADE
jgi:DNA polymerase-3 subunit gamma/tau